MTSIGGLDLASIAPFAIVVGVGILVLFFEIFQRRAASREYLSYISAIGFGVAGVAALFLTQSRGYVTFNGMNFLDGYSQIMNVLYCGAGALTVLAAPRYLEEHGIDRGEFYALTLFSVSGMMIMTSAANFVTFFLGLEIMSIAVYALAAYLRGSKASAEAGLKYFVIGAFATGLLLYGIALIYGATGSTDLTTIGAVLGGQPGPDAAEWVNQVSRMGIAEAIVQPADNLGAALNPHPFSTPLGEFTAFVPFAVVGMVLVIVAFCVKIAAAPFHMWAPDAYTGAPTPIVGFMAGAVKAAGFAALLRVLILAFFGEQLRSGDYGWIQIFFFVALASMVLGNLAAIVQDNVKRMLAYSSIAHAGYMLVAVTAMGYGEGNIQMADSIVFYLFTYTIGTIGAFAVLSYLGKKGASAETYDDLNGIGLKYPWIGAAMTVFMLSSAGIPPAAGFMGKFFVFRTAIEAGVTGQQDGTSGWAMMIALVVVGIIVSVAGVYYYLRVLIHMYMKPAVKDVQPLEHGGAKFAIAVCAVLTMALGILPGALTKWSDRAVEQMANRPDGVYVDYEDGVPVDSTDN